MTKDLSLSRDELDARNILERPKEYEEIVAELYNDDTLVFFTEVLPELHGYFAKSMKLAFEFMPGGAITPEETALPNTSMNSPE